MSLRIEQKANEDKWTSRISVPLLQEIYPRELVCDILTQLQRWEERERKLSQLMMVYLLIAWHLFLNESLRAVFLHLSASLRLLCQMPASQIPTKGAFLHRRKQLGIRVLRTLMRHCCKPLATTQTPGAFAFGYRLTAIDGTLEDVADSAENTRFFGRMTEGETASPYPQARCVYLQEVGTHLIFDAILAPCRVGEKRLIWGLLRSITADMLVLLDRGFVMGSFLQALQKRGAHVLAHLSEGIFLKRERCLPDGSYLTTLSSRNCKGLRGPMTVRIIEYWISPAIAEKLVAQPPSRCHSYTNATNPDVAKKHRLITTLLDPVAYPALELCVLYHERWEIELSIDEMKNHLRISGSPVRSCLPLLALQELYALLLTRYAIGVVMLRAAASAGPLDPDRISFTLCVQSLRDAIVLTSHVQTLPIALVLLQVQACLVLKASLVEPRRLRFNCRVVKYISHRFHRKRPHHHNLHIKNSSFADILVI